MEEWLDMYGLNADHTRIDNKEKLKEEIEEAYRNYNKITWNLGA